MIRWRSAARRSLPYLVSGTAGFLLAYLIVAFFVFPPQLISSDLPVPAVAGLDYENARARLESMGFRAKRGEERYHESAPAGTVLGQSPAPRSLEPEGTAITLDVSLGQRRGTVPEVAGLSQSQAELAIQNAGLGVGEVTVQNDTTPRGQVLASTPAAGASVVLPGSVALVVSAGPATVTVPDLVGQSANAARTMLSQIGLTLGSITVDSTSFYPAGTVVAQSPAASSSAPARSPVRITISGQSAP